MQLIRLLPRDWRVEIRSHLYPSMIRIERGRFAFIIPGVLILKGYI